MTCTCDTTKGYAVNSTYSVCCPSNSTASANGCTCNTGYSSIYNNQGVMGCISYTANAESYISNGSVACYPGYVSNVTLAAIPTLSCTC